MGRVCPVSLIRHNNATYLMSPAKVDVSDHGDIIHGGGKSSPQKGSVRCGMGRGDVVSKEGDVGRNMGV